ncbi:hypothetical protein [Streptomyces sp. NPDC000410]|uniref:hypothetical protein n=1 Tax=Streptomyces sp. NPDC000410 TaxID=3154254 RepID=UPI00331D080A
MEAELVALATAGATTLVQQMATDGWTRAKERLVAFFARHGTADEESAAADLDIARAELVEEGAEEQTEADITAEWRNRLRRTLRADPEAAAELRALLKELAPEQRAPRATTEVHNTVNGGVHHGGVIQSGVSTSVSFGGPESRRRPG